MAEWQGPPFGLIKVRPLGGAFQKQATRSESKSTNQFTRQDV